MEMKVATDFPQGKRVKGILVSPESELPNGVRIRVE